jgi:metal-responsive CopG/Arc/MetJ family transcriptional regulator
MKVISIKLPADLDRNLTEWARQQRTSRSAVVRTALASMGKGRKKTFAQVAGNLIGCLVGGPGDLATNKKHLERFGR